MRSLAALMLAGFTVGCGGSTDSTPRDADVLGTWIVTFSSTTSCSLGQIAFILTESPTGAPTGSHGSYAISCPGAPNDQEDPGPVLNWQVSEDRFAIQVTNTPKRGLNGTVSGATMTGTFTWPSMSGTFSAAKQ